MTPDERLRQEERDLRAGGGGDARGWSKLSREHERRGRRADAVRAAYVALRANPDPERVDRLRALDAADGPWPQDRGDPANSQASPLEGPDEGALRWRLDVGRVVVPDRALVDLQGRPVVHGEGDRTLRVGDDGRTVEDLGPWPAGGAALVLGEPAALDAQRLRPVPVREAVVPPLSMFDTMAQLRGLPRSGAPPEGRLLRGPGGQTYACLPDSLVALRASATARWRVALEAKLLDLATGVDGTVLVAVGTALRVRCLALEAATGAVRWSQAHELVGADPLRASVTAAADGGWLCCLGRRLLALEPDGALRWSHKLEASVVAPATAGDRVLLATGATVEELELASGALRWRRRLRVGEPPTLDARGIVYVTTADGRLLGLRRDGATHCQAYVRGTARPGAPSLGFDGTAFVAVGRELVAVR